MEENINCSVCKQPVQIVWNYCPNCGNVLRVKPLSTSLGKQLIIYAISFFLPPFGLGYAFKYLRQDSLKSQIVGTVIIILTVLSIVTIIISFKSFMDYYAKILNSISAGHYPLQ